jgi:hypothetical protein
MEEVVWVEILSRSRDVIARYRCAGAEIRVGRGYGNDVVIDDPYVAPQHLCIRRNGTGGWIAEDLGSANGLFLGHGQRKLARADIDGDGLIRIGHTYLRVRETTHAVTPDRIYQRRSWIWPLIGGLSLSLAAIQAGSVWLGDTTEPRVSAYLVPVLTLALLLVGWTSLWSLLSRIFSGAVRFERNLVIALAGVVIYSLFRQFTDFAAFAFSWQALAAYQYVGVWSLLAAVCFLHLREVSTARLRLKGGVLMAVLAIAIGMQLLNQSELHTGTDQQAYLRRMLPPEFRLARLQNEEAFFADIEQLKSKLDHDRTEEQSSPTPIESPVNWIR